MLNNKSLIIAFCLILLLPAISLAQEGYYRLGKEQIQFRFAVEDIGEAKGETGWEELTNLENKRFFVSKKAELDSSDVDGVLVEKSPFGDESYEIIIYFKKKSWDKVRDITSRNIKKRLGTVMHGKLFMAPEIFEAIDVKASIVGNIYAPTVEWFVKGFTRAEEPTDEKTRRDEEKKRCKDELVKRVEKDPNDIDAKIGLASEYFFGNPKDYRKAADLYEQITKKQPSRTDILSLLAECYTSLNEYEKAVKTLERAIAINPSGELTTRLQLADVYKRWGKHDNSANELEKSLKILSSSSKQDKEQWIEVIKNMKRELRRTPDAATCAGTAGTVQERVATCTRAITSGQLSTEELAMSYYDRGVIWRNKEDNDKAIADFSEAIRLDPLYANGYINRGLVWQNKRDNDKAILDFSEAIRLSPQYALAYYNRGIAWMNKGEYDKAIADFNEAIRLKPEYNKAYANRGFA